MVTAAMPPTVRIEEIERIADAYDLFLVDQWGVLHDGQSPYPAAIEVLARLRARGRRVVLLSNSARRTEIGIAKLTKMGVDRSLYDDLVTSGEQTWRYLKDRPDPFARALGQRCILFSWGYEGGLTGGTGIEVVEDVGRADFILNAGTDRARLDAYEPILRAAVGRDLPMVCANPDLVTVSPTGELIICPGSVARRYEELGGRVRYHGKPGRAVYQACFDLYPEAAARAVGIGDSLHHDIAGAIGAGIASVLVAGGIHAADLHIEPGAMPGPENLAALVSKTGQRPDYVIPLFRW